MTTETKIGLTELLAKAHVAREARWQEQEAERAAAQAERQRRFGEAVAQARAIVEPALGECGIDGYDSSANVRLLVTPRVWKGLVTFDMETEFDGAWKLSGANVTFYLFGPDEWELSGGPLAWLEAMAGLFRERCEAALVWYTANIAATRDETVARETHAQLLVLDETRAEEWDALLAAALDRIAARAAAIDAYVQALGEWRYEYEKTLAANRATVADIQPRFDDEFDRAEIAYAAVADVDEYGEVQPYRETAWVWDNASNVDGYWLVFEGGQVVRRRFPSLLWVGETITQRMTEAGPGPWRAAVHAYEAGQPVYCLPCYIHLVREELDRRMVALPAEPTPPAFLGDGLTAEERERINEVARGMARVEIPF
jgi:hypothetical protein